MTYDKNKVELLRQRYPEGTRNLMKVIKTIAAALAAALLFGALMYCSKTGNFEWHNILI